MAHKQGLAMSWLPASSQSPYHAYKVSSPPPNDGEQACNAKETNLGAELKQVVQIV